MASNPYWKGNNQVGRFIRFLNLAEPGSDLVISLSKVMLWLCIALFAWVIVNRGDITSFSAAVGVMLAAIGNYAYRRSRMYAAGKDPYEPEKDQEHDETEEH